MFAKIEETKTGCGSQKQGDDPAKEYGRKAEVFEAQPQGAGGREVAATAGEDERRFSADSVMIAVEGTRI